MNRSFHILAIIAALFNTAPAQTYSTLNDQTFRLGNIWTFQELSAGFGPDGAYTDTDVETFRIPRLATIDGREAVILELRDDDGPATELAWIANATEFRELQQLYRDASGVATLGFAYESDSGAPGILALPKEVTAGQSLPPDTGDGVLAISAGVAFGRVESTVLFEGRETLTTRLGDFECTRIRVRLRQDFDGLRWTETRTFWLHSVCGIVQLALESELQENGATTAFETSDFSLVSAVVPGLNRYVTADKLLARGAVADADFEPTGDGRLDAADLLATP